MSQQSANALVHYLLKYGDGNTSDEFKIGYLVGHEDGQTHNRKSAENILNWINNNMAEIVFKYIKEIGIHVEDGLSVEDMVLAAMKD